MTLSVRVADPTDAAAIARLRSAANGRLGRLHGDGPWGSRVSERLVLAGMRAGRVLVALDASGPIGTLRLQQKKPWAIRPELFTVVRRPLHLVDMAVSPDRQGQGIGRRMLAAAREVAGAWPADAIRLDAWDGPAGAGGFYARCGYREVGRATYRGARLVYFELLIPPRGSG